MNTYSIPPNFRVCIQGKPYKMYLDSNNMSWNTSIVFVFLQKKIRTPRQLYVCLELNYRVFLNVYFPLQ